jgi:secreted PhoX family phosphatase
MTAERFEEVLARRLHRRHFMGVAGLAVAGALTPLSAQGASSDGFQPVAAVPATTPNAGLTVPEGYEAQVLLRWGDPLSVSAPAFDPTRLTGEAQRQQFGYNCDFVGYFPLEGSSRHGLLVVNHEYNNPELMFPAYRPKEQTLAQVEVMMESVGLSVVEIRCEESGRWQVVLSSPFNRRISATTPMKITGPAAGHPWVGAEALGTMNNCSAGKTPWGTVLSGEENFQDAFANAGLLPANDPRRLIHLKQYTLSAQTPEYDGGWWRFHDRFDVSKQPNEPFKFGWIVEVDPFDPKSTPKKRTALGRIKHEAATFAQGKSGQAVFYTGDDEKFQCVYKFVSKGKVQAERAANADLLDEGTLYVARFRDNGEGDWLPLVHGQAPLEAANGFASQADVLIQTRRAAHLVGGTLMDRPEDIETHPQTGKVYIVLTNNSDRGKAGKPATDAANPRGPNKFGHIIELTEAQGDHASTSFTWNLLLLAGPPQNPLLSCPDNVCFDRGGTLWVATDGAPKSIQMNDGLFAVPLAGPDRGRPRQFLSAPTGSEVCGPEFTPDGTTLFVAIQHPGESEKTPSTFENPLSRWPDQTPGMPPRPSVVAIRRRDGGVIRLDGSAAKD